MSWRCSLPDLTPSLLTLNAQFSSQQFAVPSLCVSEGNEQ